MHRSSIRWFTWLFFLLGLPVAGLPADVEEFAVKRQEIFEFAETPKIHRDGDKVTITFASKGYCDATVAIEDASGRIIRHLASGCLGPNAPAPFEKNALRQTVAWDGKDDKGRYVDRGDAAARVSLGLRPRFERVLYWEPKRRTAPRPSITWGRTGPMDELAGPPLLQATEEGVFVYDGGWVDHLRVFDHDGNYVRAVYPFPADRLDKVAGLQWQNAPQDGRRLPVKQGATQATLLTSGDNLLARGGAGDGIWGSAAKAMAVRAGRIALCDVRLNRLATDGSSGGLTLSGPRISIALRKGRDTVAAIPRSAALSPDGRWLYLTRFAYSTQAGFYVTYHYLPGVARVDMQADGEPTAFLGSMAEGDVGADNGRFSVPCSVACDREGRVYVCDYMNDRVQVFSAAGGHLKTLRVERPTQVMVHQRTGDIYVASWLLDSDLLARTVEQAAQQNGDVTIKAVLHRFGPLERPQLQASYPLPLEGYTGKYVSHSSLGGWQYGIELDSWTDPPTFWLVPGAPEPWDQAGIRLLVEKDGRLTVRRDFAQDALGSVGRANRPAHLRGYLFVNPKTGQLFVGERDRGGLAPATTDLVCVDPQTGKVSFVKLPLAAYDIAFDLDGLAYLRFEDVVGRFDPTNWREVPWDYGEQRDTVGLAGARTSLASAIVAPGCRGVYSAVGGMGVSARGHFALYTYESGKVDAERYKRKEMWASRDEGASLGAEGGRKFVPRSYPGRVVGQEVHVWDEHGRLLFEDAITGVAKAEGGLGIDKDANLYIVASPNRVIDGKPYFRESAGTWMKFKPATARFLSSSETAPVPLPEADKPRRPPDVADRTYMRSVWIEGVLALYGGVGFFHTNMGQRCMCHDSRFALDYFARSFLPELDHYSVAVLDANGNLIVRIGQYGNADSAGPASRAPLDGDGVGLFDPRYLATHTDRRLFIHDVGNARIVSVTLDYHATERVRLGETRTRPPHD